MTASLPSEVPIEHNEYFFDDGDTLFLVENVLFCVHAYFLRRESTTFISMLDDSADTSHGFLGTELDPEVVVERLSMANLEVILGGRWIYSYVKRGYIIEGYSSTAFSNLLWMFYNTTFDYTPTSGDIGTDRAIHRWQSILSSSVLFHMPKLRKIASGALTTLSDSLDAPTMIQLARVYRLGEEWAWKAWVKICTREESLGKHDADRLGMGYLIKIIAAREQLIAVRPVGDESVWLKANLPNILQQPPPSAPLFSTATQPDPADVTTENVKKGMMKKKLKGKK